MQSQNKIESENILRAVKSTNKTSALNQGQYKIKCPECSSQRKHKNDSSLSVKIDKDHIVYNCHHCMVEEAVSLSNNYKPRVTKMEEAPKNIVIPNPVRGKEAEKFLASRGIDIDVALDSGCIPTIKNNRPVLAFTFNDENAVKYRATEDKKFWWEGNSLTLWGKQYKKEEVPHMEKVIIITEGEFDALAIRTAFKDRFTVDCFSVPNGASAKLGSEGKIDPKEDGRFKYVWNEKDKFDEAERIILATDNDDAGLALKEELARRLSRAKCYFVDFENCKDANEYLLEKGEDKLRNQIINAQPMPLKYLNTIEDYEDELESLYQNGNPRGVSTGYKSLDDLFTLKEGSLVVVTGLPNMGKSNFVTQLTVNVAKKYGMKTCFCSFEMPPALHSAQLMQIINNKPFYQLEGGHPRITEQEKQESLDFIKDHFLFMDFKMGADIDTILESAEAGVQRMGSRILVVDPFNFIQRPNDGMVTDQVSEMLNKLLVFAKEKDVLVFFVCHPAKPMDRSKKFVPTGMDISHSMNFFAKCDLGITVHRGEDAVEIHCWKSRYYWLGKQGMCKMTYNPVAGTYGEYEKIEKKYNFDF